MSLLKVSKRCRRGVTMLWKSSAMTWKHHEATLKWPGQKMTNHGLSCSRGLCTVLHAISLSIIYRDMSSLQNISGGLRLNFVPKSNKYLQHTNLFSSLCQDFAGHESQMGISMEDRHPPDTWKHHDRLSHVISC